MTPRHHARPVKPATRPSRTHPAWLVPAACALALAVPLTMIANAWMRGIAPGFPLDDAWIHLEYARTLARGGSFAYGPGEPTTTGSTSPLFTLLEAAAFVVTSREHWIGLGLSLAAHLAFVLAFARWASARLGHDAWAAFAIVLVAADGRFGMLAASGMETSLFLVCLALAFAAHAAKRPLATGLALGLAMWVRPESLALAAVFALDAALAPRDERSRRDAWTGVAAFAALAAAWFTFNLLAGGGWLPQTMAAKTAYYGRRTLAAFASEDVLPTLGGAWLLLLPFFVFAIWRTLRATFARAAAPGIRAEAAWAIVLVAAYAVSLRYSHRFNRYLVPLLPAYALVAISGLRDALAAWTRGRTRNVAAIAAAVLLLVAQALYFAPTLGEWGDIVRYTRDRHEAAGRWLAANTPANAIVATHDVGAIAFYSHRRVVDLAGLVTPEVVPHIGRPDFVPFLDALLARRNVTHVAVLEEWMGVAGAEPLWQATPVPEVLSVYPWRPDTTHLIGRSLR